MKSLKCSDLGMESCGFEVHGETDDEVKQKMMLHAEDAHPEVLENMSDKKMQEIDQHMSQNII